jgi:hypothetical protein
MQVFGYKKDSEELMELGEVTFLSNIEELEKLIRFFQETKAQHSKAAKEIESFHSHFRDWDTAWQEGSADIIVAQTKAPEGGS